MYVSKYYTCEEIDQRLLEGYFDDFVNAGFVGTKEEFFAFVLSISNKVDGEEGKGLSANDFTDELKQKLDSIQEGARAITKVSELENDRGYQTAEEVKEAINKLVGGASEALDTLKELEDALGGDPNFANTITNKLVDIGNKITEEISRAQTAEQELNTKIEQLKLKAESDHTELEGKIKESEAALKSDISDLQSQVDDNKKAISDLGIQLTAALNEAKEYARSLVVQESERAQAAEKANADNIANLVNTHILDKAE